MGSAEGGEEGGRDVRGVLLLPMNLINGWRSAARRTLVASIVAYT